MGVESLNVRCVSARAPILHDRIIVPGTFRELDEVCSEVPEDSRVLRVRRLWFPTSDRLQTWLILSGTTRSRQFHESTIV